MTVSYQYDVASSTSGGFIRLLFRWRGSVWKMVYRELLVFTLTYMSVALIYRFLLTEFQKRIFEQIVVFCSTFMDFVPLSFVLGFYVAFIASRWWNQYIAIPWPDKLMNSIALYVPGVDETSRVLRRTLMRYLNVAMVLVLRSISMAVKRRFPTREHLVEAGFMTKLELEMLRSVPSTEFNTFWIPCTWFINLLREAKQECHISDSNGLKLIMEQEFNEFRSKCGMLWSYDWISIPLVYTQVVTLATYSFFGACIFGRQYVEQTPPNSAPHRFEFYIPIFTIFQLFFYMGLLKVAEQLINPFGDDDEDFELNWIIDRHVKVSYLGVDLLNTRPPPLVRDSYFYQQDMKLPYTEASVAYKRKTYRGSVAKMHIPHDKQNLVVPEFSEDDDEDRIAKTYGMGGRGASLWTLVGGKLNTRFSVSNQNLDTVTLESGSNNWKVSNPSLFNAPISPEGIVNDGSVTFCTGNGIHTPEMPPELTQSSKQLNQPRSSIDGIRKVMSFAAKKKPGKRIGGFLPNIRRKAIIPNRWIAFQSTPQKEDKDGPLSLFSSPEADVSACPQSTLSDSLHALSMDRRQSFDERSAMLFMRSRVLSPKFQSLPDVQQFAVNNMPPERAPSRPEVHFDLDSDNGSTSNLLVVEESPEPEEYDVLVPTPPHLIFTRASMSPSSSEERVNRVGRES